MSEYRFVGSAVDGEKRVRVAFTKGCDPHPECMLGFEHIFNRYCYDRDYWSPVLLDWYLV